MKRLITALLIPLLIAVPELAFAQRGVQAIVTQQASAGSVLKDSFTTAATARLSLRDSSTDTKIAYQWVAGSSYSLTAIELNMCQYAGSPSGNVTVSVYNDNGLSSPNTAPGTSDFGDSTAIAASSITASCQLTLLNTMFNFASSVSITNGTSYWIVVSGTYTISASNYCAAYYFGGTGGYSATYNGSAWSNTNYATNQGMYATYGY